MRGGIQLQSRKGYLVATGLVASWNVVVIGISIVLADDCSARLLYNTSFSLHSWTNGQNTVVQMEVSGT